MDNSTLLVILVVLMGAAGVLAIWMRRDRGIDPRDRLAEALHEHFNGREGM